MKNPKFAAALLAACRTWMSRSTIVDPGHDLNLVANAARAMDAAEPLPRVVCLCGSTRFYEDFQRANFAETMAGKIVLSVGFYPHGGFESRQLHGSDVGVTEEEKVELDRLHKRKIDLADEVLVLNRDGYIGSSTRSEVEYAKATGKPVRWAYSQVPSPWDAEPTQDIGLEATPALARSRAHEPVIAPPLDKRSGMLAGDALAGGF